MSSLPIVAIIGKPNTGKSTLFNRIIGQRKAIESEVAGTTRDHISHRIETDAVDYLLLDTGGMGTGTADEDFEEDVFEQSMLALEKADVILFLIDSRSELTTDDHVVIEQLRKKRRRHVPIILVLSKADDERKIVEVRNDAYALGISDDIIPVSSIHRHGTEELEQMIVAKLTSLHFKKEILDASLETADTPPRLAVIGKPNVGKSSLINALMAEPDRQRSPLLVSDIAGTTRDAVDTVIHRDGRAYVLVDTAGLKKNGQMERDVERFAMLRTIQAIESADIVALVLDATQTVSHQDKRIAGMAVESGKGMIVLLNKIDLLTTEQRKAKVDELFHHLNFCRFASVLPVSAKTKSGIVKLLDIVDSVSRSRARRVPTRELHRWFERVTHGQPLGEIAKAKHITQANEIPPTFVIFVKNPKRVGVTQLRYLDNRLRETFGFEGTPVRWITKAVEDKRKLDKS